MLKVMRDSFHRLKWILLAVVAAFVFGFVFIDMGLGRGGVGRASGAKNFAARVNGETISYADYYRAYKRVEDMYRQMYGQQFTPELSVTMGLPKQVIDNLVDDRLLLQEAERMNLDATSEEVRARLLEIPQFQQDGKFIGMELYNRYVTGPLGYQSAADFEADLAREIALQKMDSALRSSVVVSTKAADDEYRRTAENASIRYVLLRGAEQAAKMTVSPAEVEAYYKAHQADFQHKEQRKIRYLIAEYSKIRQQLKPTEADMRKAYEADKEKFRSPAAAQVQHILVKVDPGAPAAVDAAAKAKAQSLVAQLRSGADFAAVAKANSQDPSSAANGGSMGWVAMGDTVPEFERAIFSIPLNTISDPIRSADYGYHIVKVTARRDAGFRSFEEVRPQLEARAAQELAKEVARTEITRINAQLREKKPASAADFAALANDKVTSNESGWFGATGAIPGLGSQPPLSQWVFAAKKGEISDPVPTPRGMAIAYVEDTRGAGITPLDEIRRRVEMAVKQDKANAAAQAALTQMMAGATSIDQVAQKAGQQPREATVTRQGGVAGLQGDTGAIVEAAMTAAPGQLKGPITTREGAVVLQVVSQKKVSEQELAQNRPQAIERLRGEQMRSVRAVLLDRLRKASEIEVDDSILRPTVTPAGV